MSQRHLRLALLRHDAATEAAVQTLLERAADYSINVTGLPPGPADGASFFTDLPPATSSERKHCFGFYERNSLVGCADTIKGWPNEHKVMIGLLLLEPAARGRGLGEQALALLTAEFATWPGIDTLRIAVVDTNPGALPFWCRMGFVETGETKPHEEGVVRSTKRVLQRPLHDIS